MNFAFDFYDLKGVLVVGSTDGLVGLVPRIVRRKSDVEMTAYSSLACVMASLRVALFDAMFVITSGDFFLCLT